MGHARRAGFGIALGLVFACGGRGESLPVIRATAPPLLASEIQLASPISAEPDGGGFAIASEVAPLGGRVVVLETGNERLVVFDDQYRPSRYIGHAGAGPGELRGAVGLAAWRDQFAVSEVNNARVSIFDTSGAFLRSFPVPNGLSHLGYGPDGRIYVDSYDRAHYLLVTDRGGALRPFAARPLDRYPADVLAAPESRIGGYVPFAVLRDGSVHVYDGILAALIGFDSAGRSTRMRRLPAHIERGLRNRAAMMARDFGGDGKGAPASISSLSLTDAGRILILHPNFGSIGLLIDPIGDDAREIRWGPAVDPKLAGYGGVIWGDVFYRLTMDDLRLFRLSPQ